MSSDSVSPSSLSLRTSFLKSAVSRPTRAARSGARTVGWRSIRSSVSRVQAPYDEALSSRSSRPLISRDLGRVGDRLAQRLAGVGAGVDQADAPRRVLRAGRERLLQRLERRGARPPGVLRREAPGPLDRRHLEQPHRRPHPGADHHPRPRPPTEREVDGACLDRRQLGRSDHHGTSLSVRAQDVSGWWASPALPSRRVALRTPRSVGTWLPCGRASVASSSDASPDPTARRRASASTARPGPRWFDADSEIVRVHGDASMFIGGIRARAPADDAPGRDEGGGRPLRLPRRHVGAAGPHQPVPRGDHLRHHRARRAGDPRRAHASTSG